MSDPLPSIAIIGGTGALGSGLAFRWAKAGYPIMIGSRNAASSAEAAAALNARLSCSLVSGGENLAVAEQAQLIVVTVPFASHQSTMEKIRQAAVGKVVLDTTVPLVPPKVSRVQLSEYWPAARSAQKILGDQVRVVSAFHNVAAAHLQHDNGDEKSDVLVCGNDPAARAEVITLVEAAGYRGWHAGPIDNSVVGEALTSVLIFINKRYGIQGSGIQIVGHTQ